MLAQQFQGAGLVPQLHLFGVADLHTIFAEAFEQFVDLDRCHSGGDVVGPLVDRQKRALVVEHAAQIGKGQLRDLGDHLVGSDPGAAALFVAQLLQLGNDGRVL